MMRFELTTNGFHILTSDGWKMHPPMQTKIVEAHVYNSLVVIREDYVGFIGSNVYALDQDLNKVWDAELPHPSDIFANVLTPIAGGFVTSTWNGIQCNLDGKTGKITKLGITK